MKSGHAFLPQPGKISGTRNRINQNRNAQQEGHQIGDGHLAAGDRQRTEHNDHQHDDESKALKLNSGVKWVVNEEMKPFILEAESILNQHIKSQSQDYQALAAQLKEKNSGLIKSCTMKGESHDELHKWLHPHIELIESLSNAETAEEANKIITHLQTSFSTYNQYFQ